MRITIKNSSEYKLVRVTEGGATIDMDFLDVIESEDLAITFIEAAYDLMRGRFNDEEEYYQWLKDNT